MAKEVFSASVKNLYEAFKRARSFDYLDYPENGIYDPLWALLGYKDITTTNTELLRAVLIKFAREMIPNPTDSDIVLMAFGLLRGYEHESDIGNRRRRCLEHSSYFEHAKDKNYKDYTNSEDYEVQRGALDRAANNLQKKEERLFMDLAKVVAEVPNLRVYAEHINDYLSESRPYRAIIQEPRSPLKINSPEDHQIVSEDQITVLVNEITDVRQTVIQSTKLIIEKIETRENDVPLQLAHSCPVPLLEFVGREDELHEIGHRLARTGQAVLSGLGGIGKTELVKQFAYTNKDKYTSVCYLSYDGSILTTISRQLPVTSFESNRRDAEEDYQDKLNILLGLDERTLLIIDDFNDFSDPRYGELSAGKFHIIFVSNHGRDDALFVGALPESQQIELFSQYYKRCVTEEENARISEILRRIEGHTLTISLLAKSLYLDRRMNIEKASRLISSGIHHVSDFVRFALEELFDVGALADAERYILVNMTLVPNQGMPVGQFGDWIGLESFDDLQKLIDSHWIQLAVDKDIISLPAVLSDLIAETLKPDSEQFESYLESLIAFSSDSKNSDSAEKRRFSGSLIEAAMGRVKDNRHVRGRLAYNNFTYNHAYENYTGKFAGWGPERKTFTWDDPAPYAVFNSMSDNPGLGNERLFMRIRSTSDRRYARTVRLEPGKTYEVYSYYHNNAGQDCARKGIGIADNVRMRANFPARIRPGEILSAYTTISARFSDQVDAPREVWAGANVVANEVLHLHYVPGSAIIHNSGKLNGQNIGPSYLFGKEGALLGYNTVSGILPGTSDYAGYVTYRFRADYADFSIRAVVRKAENDNRHMSLRCGEADMIVFEIDYVNTGSMIQENVRIKAELPETLRYVVGSSTLQNNSSNFEPHLISDNIVGPYGANIGTYSGMSGRATLRFSAIIEGESPIVLRPMISCYTADGTKSAFVDIETKDQEHLELPDGESYEGNYFDGMRHGQGKYVYADSSVYTGDFFEGEVCGNGKMLFADGAYYEGEWRFGEIIGEGAFVAVNGTKTVGSFRHGLVDGHACQTLVSGEHYEGSFVNGKRHGEGKCKWPDGRFYEGDWMFGYEFGNGILQYANGDVFEGAWQYGQPKGKGILRRKDGSIFTGEWSDEWHGAGTIQYASESEEYNVYRHVKYEGAWFKNKPNNKGCMNYTNGDMYDGEWVNAKKHGNGSIVYANGDRYTGGWYQDKWHHMGTYVHAEGQHYIGGFMCGHYHGKGKLCFKSGSVYIGEFVDGKRNGMGIFFSSLKQYWEGLWEDDALINAERFPLYDTPDKQVLTGYEELVTADDMCGIAEVYLNEVKRRDYSMQTKNLSRRSFALLRAFVNQATRYDVLNGAAVILRESQYKKEAVRSGDRSLYALAESCESVYTMLSARLKELESDGAVD